MGSLKKSSLKTGIKAAAAIIMPEIIPHTLNPVIFFFRKTVYPILVVFVESLIPILPLPLKSYSLRCIFRYCTTCAIKITIQNPVITALNMKFEPFSRYFLLTASITMLTTQRSAHKPDKIVNISFCFLIANTSKPNKFFVSILILMHYLIPF